MMKAVVLLSGGLDSATALALAKEQGFDCYALSFDYGQRHRVELVAAARVAEDIGVAEHKHWTLAFRLPRPGSSALLDRDAGVPRDRPVGEEMLRLPVTYVPARNTIFLSFALNWAESLEASDIVIGANALDYSGYPDCRPAYIEAFEKMARLGTTATKLKIHAPLIHMTKAEIIREGVRLGVDYGLTHSCYDPQIRNLACGHCDSCLIRKRGFAQAEVLDPTTYAP